MMHDPDDCPFCRADMGFPYYLRANRSECSNCGEKIEVGVIGVYCGMISVPWSKPQVHAFLVAPETGECPKCKMSIRIFAVTCKEGKGWS